MYYMYLTRSTGFMVIISRGILEHNVLLWYHHSMHGEQEQYYGDFFLFLFLAVPRHQEKTYPAALPACPIDVGCLGGIMGGFKLLPPVHVFRNVFEAPLHPIMSQCPVRHPVMTCMTN